MRIFFTLENVFIDTYLFSAVINKFFSLFLFLQRLFYIEVLKLDKISARIICGSLGCRAVIRSSIDHITFCNTPVAVHLDIRPQ